MSVDRKVARGLAWVSFASGVVAVCDLVSLALILRFWVPKGDYGLASMVLTTFGALQLVVEAGLPSAVVQRDLASPGFAGPRSGARGSAEVDADQDRLSSVFWFNIAAGFGLYGLLFVAAPLIADAQGEPMVGPLFRVAGMLLLLRPLYTTHQALLRKQLDFDRLSQVRVVANLLELGVKVGSAAAGAGVWCWVLGAAVRELTYAIGVPAVRRWFPRRTFSFAKIKDDFRFGLRSTGAEVIYQVYSNADYQVVGFVFGKEALGAYRAAYELVLEPVRFLSNIVTTIALPAFARLRHDRGAVVEQLVAFTRQNLAVVLLFVGVIVVTADDLLILVYGREFSIAADAARVLAIVGALRALSHLGPPLLDGLGRPGLTLRYQITAAVVLSAAFAVAGKLGGSFDAIAWAWAVGYPIPFLVMVGTVLALLDLRPRAFLRRIWRMVALLAAATGAGWLVQLATPSWGHLARFLAAGGTVVALGAAALALVEGFTPRQIARRVRGPDAP